jgi:hypothetical protein
MLPDVFRFLPDSAVEANLPAGAKALLARARAMAATWQALTVITSARYRRERLSLFVEIGEDHPFYSKSEGRADGSACVPSRGSSW